MNSEPGNDRAESLLPFELQNGPFPRSSPGNFLPNLLNIHFDETGEFYLGRVGDVTEDSGILVGSLVKNHVSEDVLKVGDDNFLPAFGGQQLAKLLQNNVRNVVAFVSYQARN